MEHLTSNGYRTFLLALLVTSVAVSGAACRGKKRQERLSYQHPLPPGAVALRKASPDEYPDFGAALGAGNLDAVRAAIGHSLDYLSRPSSRAAYPYLDITHERAVATLKALDEVLQTSGVLGDPPRLNALIVERFDVYKSVGAPREADGAPSGTVLFTGYFTPVYEASLTPSDAYRWPLYGRPDDLLTDPATGQALGRRTPDGRLVPYYTRAEIERDGALRGREIVWLKDRWEAYVVTVQGSAQLRLTDGRTLELGYAGHNGHEYASPAMKMVDDGVIERSSLSASALQDYFRRHPRAMDKYLWHNPRTVFFAERAGGPYGSLNVPVTPRATIATDKAVYPRALPALAAMRGLPRSGARDVWWPSNCLVLDQDTGGAIRAAGRCDLYMGVGERAGHAAGYVLRDGELFYLAVKEKFVPQYVRPAAAAQPSSAFAEQRP